MHQAPFSPYKLQIYVYVCMHACMYVCMYACMYVCVSTHCIMCICVCVLCRCSVVYITLHKCMRIVYAYAYVHAYGTHMFCVYMRMYKHMVHIYVCVCTRYHNSFTTFCPLHQESWTSPALHKR